MERHYYYVRYVLRYAYMKNGIIHRVYKYNFIKKLTAEQAERYSKEFDVVELIA